MKKLILVILIITMKITYNYSQIYNNFELLIWNESVTNTKINAKIFPVSIMINGENTCDLVAHTRGSYNGHTQYYINGVEYYYTEKKTNWELTPGQILYFDIDQNSDGEDPPLVTHGKLGYGIYKIIIVTINVEYLTHIDSLTIDIDASNYLGDQCIRFRDDNNDPRTLFQYQFEPENQWIRISQTNYQMKPWIHYNRQREYGDAYFAPFGELTFPLDSRKDCNRVLPPPFNPDYKDQNQSNGDARSGNLTLNLDLYGPDIFTPVQNARINFPTVLNILKYNDGTGPTLTLGGGSTLTLKYDSWYTSNNNRFTVLNDYKNFVIESQAVFTIENKNIYNMYRGSNLYLESSPYPNIYVKPGGKFCNYGGIISGGGKIKFESGTIVHCADMQQDFNVQDSTQILFEDSCTWILEPNSTVSFDGNVTCLIMNPYSEIKFGENSKLVFQNGAHLIADHAKFTSVDGNSTWDGIYLEDLSNDTITNCTIENAVNGINITDKINQTREPVPTTEISNCTFSNTTNTQLTNGIYVNNSQNVLIKGNNFTSSQLTQGFANGIMIEYCMAGTPLVVDNNIDKVLTGIFVSQSSPYIARNTITGAAESGRGIELDNSNGTIKYNIVSNFVNSYATGYSSPYLLKNTFSGASETNIEIYANSIPILRPVNSGTTLSWLAGDNHITGYPSISGIYHHDDSYPVMDSGFNIINVNGSDYMSGDIPPSLDGLLAATRNYWTDVPPSSQKFNVTGGSVVYDPAFDCSSYPPIDYYDLTALRFGLYDTVYVESLGDNPGAENLFMQAYQSERNGQYLNAIYLYKQVITNYRNSSYATVSLSRIFNCVEKRLSASNEYALLQTYMSQLRTSNLYHTELREMAEDFVIKAKVKQGYLQSAINDYETMYQQNQNNPKGIHALINKEILTAMLNDTGDTPSGINSFVNLTNHKLRLLSIITGRNFEPVKAVNISQIPHEYRLYQNYPNPFNPKTTIKYDLPKDGFVTFKVYDILGKELYSVTEHKQAGTYQITLDGSNYASGLYFYRLEVRQAGSSTGSYVETKKMVLVK
jgi:hypothetical protein